ncbi:MAG: DUF4388 domain-containing protein [Nitrospirae bacterium]|nr:DUF4388 domain-containing protein [Nitrospirota bacterium]
MKEEIPVKGNLKDYSLSEILINLNRQQKTGTLSLEKGDLKKKIYFKKGDAIFASSNYNDDRLGEMLLKAGKITLDQYDKSVELLKKTGKRQGVILVELGYLTPKDLFWGVKYQVQEIIYSLFQWEDGLFSFEEGPPTDEVITLKMSMGNLIYGGVSRINNSVRIRSEIPRTDVMLTISEDPLCLFQDVGLNKQDKKILTLVNGRRTIKEIIEHSKLGSFEAMKAIYMLYTLGIVEKKLEDTMSISVEEILKEQEAPTRHEDDAFIQKVLDISNSLGRLNYYELLGVDIDAPLSKIKRAYFLAAKNYHPDRYYSTSDATLKDKLTEIFTRLNTAYDTLKDDEKRKKYNASLFEPQKKSSDEVNRSEEQFRRGIEEFKKGNFWAAADLFRNATKLEPERAKYWSHLSLALSRVPKRQKEAEEALQRAIELEPYNADHYANLGHIYLKAGLKKRAQHEFENALKWDPENSRALKGLKVCRAESE